MCALATPLGEPLNAKGRQNALPGEWVASLGECSDQRSET